MRIGIISDTHDQIERTRLAVRTLVEQGAEALIHCGDLTTPDVVYECGVLPCHIVFGNNDYDETGIREAMTAIRGVCLEKGGEITLGGKRIAVTHGDSGKQIRRLSAAKPDYLLFGHTHVPSDAREGSTRFINPGAIHRAQNWTVALLDLDTDLLRFVKIR